MTAAVRLLTIEDVWKMPDNGGHIELICGELHPMSPANSLHGKLAMTLGAAIHQFARGNALGVVVSAETGFIITRNPDTLLAPDAAFIRRDRIPADGLSDKFFDGPPDLAVEIMSPHDSWQEVEHKTDLYINAGTRLVWIVNPKAKSVTVYQPGGQIKLLRAPDALSGEDVLPGFTLPIAEIFE
ncbi:MAG: Uma2 family endonuclease [Phycisphaerae bacterium]